ncbi:fumarylacetoacetate hydrolase family protein [Pseudooceanicola algae]|uniref:Fumarylpyruvate hydrolase n=1 Tax=Pseudooceanicola algae TaxID=1537215 RepID=A0A418SGS8_9RHOB|nr:fumarylacetoacetate hydrolase family protein [Pseudooceanicola algae]QPM91741.1 Fumarylpyruvate hydrolase [Pseudooceanicola algae]
MSMFDLPPLPEVPIIGESDTYPLRRIFCVGRNYAAHAREYGFEPDLEAPFYFTKSPASAVLSGAETPYPPNTESYHFELELAVYLKAPLFRATREEAVAAIYAYGCALDMTRRDLQIRERKKQRPWDLGKDVENSAVFAPATKAADFGTVAAQRISLTQNGTMKQDSTLDLMLHDVAAVLCDLSGYYHLGAGDVIMTGTPEGVGPVQPGDLIEGRIDGLEPISLRITDPA